MIVGIAVETTVDSNDASALTEHERECHGAPPRGIESRQAAAAG